MKSVDWMYHRKSCETCTKADSFLGQHKIKIAEIVDAKAAYKMKEALDLLEECDRLLCTKNRKVLTVDLKKDQPTKAELENLVIGPTGKLRAPTIKVGRTLVVGFDEIMYREALN